MKRRSIAGVIIFPFLTLGIYTLYWFVKTKGELNAKGAQIPTAWLVIIPLVNIWWVWKYFEGAQTVSEGRLNGILNFVLYLFFTLIVPMVICQLDYNKQGEGAGDANTTQATENSATETEQTASQTNETQNIVSESPEEETAQTPTQPTNPPTPPIVQG
jgi:membrane protease YdiL (CAAX protease family)